MSSLLTCPLLLVCDCLQINNGAIYIPPGVYRITKPLETRKNIVYRGAGKDVTILYFPFSLTDVFGNSYSKVGGWGSLKYMLT